MEEKRIITDVLVIGGAGAGLRAAMEARGNGVDVVLASKMPAGGSSSTRRHILLWDRDASATSRVHYLA